MHSLLRLFVGIFTLSSEKEIEECGRGVLDGIFVGGVWNHFRGSMGGEGTRRSCINGCEHVGGGWVYNTRGERDLGSSMDMKIGVESRCEHSRG